MSGPDCRFTPARPISGRTLLRWQLQRAHRLLGASIDSLSDQVLHHRSSAGSMPIGASFAQVVVCEDLTVNGILAARAPLVLSTWAGRTGLSELPPLDRTGDWRPWAHRVRVDLARLRPYADAVYASTDAYLANLSDEALDPLNEAAPACLLTAMLLTVATRRGELACLRSFATP